MSSFSDRLYQAGWVIRKHTPEHYTAWSPSGNRFEWRPEKGETCRVEMERQLVEDERAIDQGAHTPFLGTARLTAPDLGNHPSLLAERIAHDHSARGHAVLRLLTISDPAGDEALSNSGAWRVESLLAPWQWQPPPGGAPPYRVLLCEHVVDVLPKADRYPLYKRMAAALHPDGEIYFSLFQMSALPDEPLRTPFEDGYQMAHGRHRVFVRPYTPAMAQREITALLHGNLEIFANPFHELHCCWRPHA
ncbi:MAG: hypothetical protein JJU29_13585 [Verrucomicrobia bacterium]|nr:hypothetical protein [Verrucomicrobiota bacterium]MCH8510657.1 hypothetical protein [Kiritimatiellia bacterium]